MELMISHVISYGSTLAEMLTSKLAAFYNKVILQKDTRLIVLLPNDTQLSRAELHKAMFNEILVTQFDPTNTQFWNCKNLYKFLYFVHATMNTTYENVYIDYGKIFTNIDSIDGGADIVVSRTLKDADLIRYVNKMLHDHCDLPLLDDEQIIYYDCSLFYVSDNARLTMQKLLQQVSKLYPEYIDTNCCYAILSCIVAHALSQNEYKINCIEKDPIDIADCGLIEDFYTLI